MYNYQNWNVSLNYEEIQNTQQGGYVRIISLIIIIIIIINIMFVREIKYK